LQLAKALALSKDFNEVFELVKRSVENTLHEHRAGLTLVLADLPTSIGAYHVVGSNVIVMNRILLGAVTASVKSIEEVNYYVYMVLMHEYLHSLGHLDEADVRRLSQGIARENLGPDHPVTKLIGGDLWRVYPQIRNLGQGGVGQDFEVVLDFDSSSMPYIG